MYQDFIYIVSYVALLHIWDPVCSWAHSQFHNCLSYLLLSSLPVQEYRIYFDVLFAHMVLKLMQKRNPFIISCRDIDKQQGHISETRGTQWNKDEMNENFLSFKLYSVRHETVLSRTRNNSKWEATIWFLGIQWSMVIQGNQ